MGNHRSHLALCGVVIAVALMAVVMSGGAPISIALLAAAVLCPLAMGVVVWLLLRPEHRTSSSAVDSAKTQVRS